MKTILQIVFIIVPFLSLSQIKITEVVMGDSIVKDSVNPNLKLRVQINELYELMTFEFFGLNSQIEGIEEYRIESICRHKNKVFVKSPVELEFSAPITINHNQELKIVQIEYDEQQISYSGQGVQIIISNVRDLERCIIRD